VALYLLDLMRLLIFYWALAADVLLLKVSAAGGRSFCRRVEMLAVGTGAVRCRILSVAGAAGAAAAVAAAADADGASAFGGGCGQGAKHQQQGRSLHYSCVDLIQGHSRPQATRHALHSYVAARRTLLRPQELFVHDHTAAAGVATAAASAHHVLMSLLLIVRQVGGAGASRTLQGAAAALQRGCRGQQAWQQRSAAAGAERWSSRACNARGHGAVGPSAAPTVHLTPPAAPLPQPKYKQSPRFYRPRASSRAGWPPRGRRAGSS
jgi:hypothetical protein